MLALSYLLVFLDSSSVMCTPTPNRTRVTASGSIVEEAEVITPAGASYGWRGMQIQYNVGLSMSYKKKI